MSYLRTLAQKNGAGEISNGALPGSSGALDGEVYEHDGAGGGAWTERKGRFDAHNESDAIVNQTATGPTTYLTLVTPNVPAGDYRIDWSYILNHSTTNSDWTALVEITGSDAQAVNNINSPGYAAEEPSDGSSTQAFERASHKVITFATPGVHTVRLAFGNPGSGTTQIRGGRLGFSKDIS